MLSVTLYLDFIYKLLIRLKYTFAIELYIDSHYSKAYLDIHSIIFTILVTIATINNNNN